MDNGEGTLSIALFSGTDDKLGAAAVLAAGAVVIGRKVDILLQYWALDAFRAGNLTKEHGLAPEAGPDGAEALRKLHEQGGAHHWSALLAQAKELGTVQVHACSLSMELLGLDRSDLIDGLEEPAGAATALAEAQDAITLFI